MCKLRAFVSRVVVLVVTLVSLGIPARAFCAEPDDAAKRFGAALIPAESPGFLSIRVDDLLNRPGVAEGLKKLAADIEPTLADAYFFGKLSNVERIVVTLVPLGDEPPAPVIILTTKNGFERERFMKMVKEMGFHESSVDKLIIYGPENDPHHGDAYCPIDDKSLAFGPAIGLVQFASSKKSNGALFDSFAFKDVSAKSQVVSAVNPGRVIPGPLPHGYETLEALHQAQWISLQLRVDRGLDAQLKAKCGKANGAQTRASGEEGLKMLAEALGFALKEKHFQDNPDNGNLIKVLQSMIDSLKDAKFEGDDASVTTHLESKVNDNVMAMALVEVAMQICDATTARACRNSLRRIDIAMVNFERANGKLPEAAICSKDGKPLLSWRVKLLPFLEQGDLYKEFKLDEPWDSEHNKKLLAKMPRTYASPGVSLEDRTLTYYKVFVGPGTPFDPQKRIALAQIPVGASNVITVVEGGEPVPWTKPEDITVDPKKPLPRLNGPYKRGINFVAGDAWVGVMPKNYSEKKLRAAIDINSNWMALQTIDEPDPEDAKGSGSSDAKPPEKGSGSRQPK